MKYQLASYWRQSRFDKAQMARLTRLSEQLDKRARKENERGKLWCIHLGYVYINSQHRLCDVLDALVDVKQDKHVQRVLRENFAFQYRRATNAVREILFELQDACHLDDTQIVVTRNEVLLPYSSYDRNVKTKYIQSVTNHWQRAVQLEIAQLPADMFEAVKLLHPETDEHDLWALLQSYCVR